ncbi:protein NDNF isoform X2 [Drosophila grimshawi]|uniref:GH20979 n=1 Tax=Drosophila grimshawi TaxID=7222 RepID=B4J4S9_DROGR|nr:protein NDNF isoform X2 [Drosophila grimshawi]EDW00625.1 GH20979 [Drosophila grimshawi]
MRRQHLAKQPGLVLLLLLLPLLLPHLGAEIAHTPLSSNRINLEPLEESQEETHLLPPSCPQRQAYEKMLNSIDDVEDLYVDVPVHIALEHRQKKRFVLKLNNSTPLTILFSMPVARQIYYNQTANVLRLAKGPTLGRLILPCALRGQYDLFVQARQGGALKLEAQAKHPHQSWPLLNHTHRIQIRTQNRVRKRQLIVKWERSKFDYHAMHYCLVIQRTGTLSSNTPSPSSTTTTTTSGSGQDFASFCEAVYAYTRQQQQTHSRAASGPCSTGSGNMLDLVWSRAPKRARHLNPRHSLHIVCTGARTQQQLRGLQPNSSYRLQLFGVHQRLQNLTLTLASSQVHFNRTQPTALREQALSLLKIGGLHGVQVYSFKVPATMPPPHFIRYLLLPCAGSEIRVKLLRQHRLVANVGDIYSPTYIKLEGVTPGERYLMRFEPSNEDEALRAQKVRLALSSERLFRDLAELPENITVFDVRTRCTSTTIAWHGSPDERALSYCVIVFNLPPRSVVDYTNYCMDFGALRITQHKNFKYIRCREKQNSMDKLETETILSLTPGDSYLIYVTANLSVGKPLPYQTLTVHMGSQCMDVESQEQPEYY